MTEGSALWDCGSGGDATAGSMPWDTPYSSAEFAEILSKLFGSHRSEGMVIPEYGNNLRVYENVPIGMTVLVAAGALFSRGRIYENTTTTMLTISAADPVLPRLDRVVARITVANQTIRLAIVTGAPASPPALPALTTTAAVWEVDIAHVYVQANTLTIEDEEIDDKRIFFDNGFQARNLLTYNIIANSEFMAFSALGGGSPTTYPPDYWRLESTPSAIAPATKPSLMSRGRYIQITSDAANEGIYQTIPIKASTTYAFHGCYNVTAGDVGKIIITTNSGTPVTLTRRLRRVGVDLEWYAYYTTEADATNLTIKLINLSATDIVKYGQFLMCEGYDAGPFREIRETLPFEWGNFGDASYNGDDIAISTPTIDFDVSFGSYVLEGTRAVQLSIKVTGLTNSSSSIRNVATDRDIIYINAGNTGYNCVSGWIALDENNQVELSVAADSLRGTWMLVTGIEI